MKWVISAQRSHPVWYKAGLLLSIQDVMIVTTDWMTRVTGGKNIQGWRDKVKMERTEDMKRRVKGRKKSKHMHWKMLFPHGLSVHHLPISWYWQTGLFSLQILKEILVCIIYVGDMLWDRNGEQNLNVLSFHLCKVTIHREVGIKKNYTEFRPSVLTSTIREMVVPEESCSSSRFHSQVPPATCLLGVCQINSILDQCLGHTKL